MRVRYTINAEGDLVSRHGVVLGRIEAITVMHPGDVVEVPAPVKELGTEPMFPMPQMDLPQTDREVATADVWATYARVMKVRRVMDAGDVLTINAALKVASVEECQRAIAGCAASDWHMGRDPQTGGKSYKQLTQILKGKRGGRTTREQIDLFIEIADKKGAGSEGIDAVDQVKLSRHKSAVMTAWEFPADDRAAAAGDEARLWLDKHGVEVVMDSTPGPNLGKPSFRAKP